MVILTSTVLVTIIIAIQLFWLQKVYLYEEKQFNINVSKSIRSLYTDMELVNDASDNVQKIIENINPDVYLFKIDCSPNLEQLWINLKAELTDFDVYTDCRAAIYDPSEKKYITEQYINLPDSYFPSEEEKILPVYERDYSYIALYFPHRGGYILKQMLFWIASSGLLLLVLTGFGFSIFYLYRQKFYYETQKDFVNNFTHEFKTPLAVITIAADVLKQENIIEKPEKLKNYAGIIYEQTSHLQSQVQRLLEIAYTDRSHLPLEKEKFDVNVLIKKSINDLQPLIEQKNAVVKTTFAGTDAIVNADKPYLRLCFINLIENAIKYAKTPVIDITTKTEGSHFIISVKDNGIGIASKHQKKIFDRFYRITDGELHTSKGFGLGLNFVKKVIDTHNGKIEVKSEPGQGSTFTIKLPRN
ncbi:MAG: HAMP domain-containing histidine kinase [Chitinophagaceae bacterium]|nr:HAMP domain-containing histidine kinase [Chitinophagaceae bacterium]MBK7122194.1 HAMP domain-containing histidine kinase [Chitinophagaceae bacterium]MBK7557961.1 HAMP domain-containing histidine kinase [Chitinophagaceae bacterium]MBK9531654.1 HAMP domain-containing histidine kinase [Chitinophagaceae bacterium]HQW92519.1 HAMP domain-containing sensor histidine kinase [Ferruginibacter sp.]